MGQNSSSVENFLPNTVDTVQYEIQKQIKTLTAIHELSYEEFQKSLLELNDLSRKIFQNTGHQLVFAIKKSTDETLLWKATVRIACVKVETTTKHIESYKLLNLKQFLKVFKTFQSHLQVMLTSENQNKTRFTASGFMNEVNYLADLSPDTDNPNAQCSSKDQFNECCICLDRKPDILLPCAHSYCYPCIEQWNMTKKNCPICQEQLNSTDDTWVLSELPDMQEVNDEIFTELTKLSNN